MDFQIANQRHFQAVSTNKAPSPHIEIGFHRISTRPFFRSKSRWGFVAALINRQIIGLMVLYLRYMISRFALENG